MAVEPIYLDNNATTPLAHEVQESIIDAMKNAWGNPSSSNVYGMRASHCMEEARKQTADMIGAQPTDIMFTSGGTEANHTVLNTFQDRMNTVCCKEAGDGGNFLDLPHIIASNIEHPATAKPLQKMVQDGVAQVSFIEVNKDTFAFDVDEAMAAIQPNTVLITIMMANNETGKSYYIFTSHHFCEYELYNN